MRITPREQEMIKKTVQECFDAAVDVRLYANRKIQLQIFEIAFKQGIDL